MADQNFFGELRYVKDVRVEEIILITHDGQAIDIYKLVNELNLYEDLYSNALSGDIVMEDGQNIPSVAPLNGNEKIIFSFHTPGDTNKISLAMNVYKISDRINVHEKKQVYSLHFTSREMIKDRTTKISKSYEGTHDQIAQRIFTEADALESERQFRTDPAAFFTKVVVPRWSPFQTMNWLAQRAVSNESQIPDYLFFETIDGFNFRSLSSLVKDHNTLPEDQRVTYNYATNQHHNEQNYQIDKLEEDFFTIETYNVKPTFDILKRISNGMYGSRLLIHDLFTRSFRDVSFDYLKHFDATQALDSNLDPGAYLQRNNNLDDEQLNTLQDSNIHIVPDHSFIFGPDIRDSRRYSQWLLQRQSEMQQIDNVVMEIQVPGDSRRRVGEIINVNIPSPQPFEEDQLILDPYLTGRYMITSIRHKVQVDNYVMVLEIAKDSFLTELPDGDRQ